METCVVRNRWSKLRLGLIVPGRLGLAAFVWLALLAVGTSIAASADSPTRWATGTQLEQKLATPLRVSWHGTTLEQALSRLSEMQLVAILRDRRIDPDRQLELVVEDQPLDKALAQIAGHLQAGYCQFGPVAIIGPEATTTRLRTLAAARMDEARALPPAAREPLLMLRTWRWDDLAEPRALVSQLAAEAGVEIVGLERIPHDLWPAADLPLLSWCDRLSLVAGQFDLTYRIGDNGRQIELVDFPAEALLERSYTGGKSPQALARRWQRELPGATFEVAGNEVRVRAPLDVHEQLERQLGGGAVRRPKVTRGKQVNQLTVDKAALDKLVDKLANDLGLTVHWDRQASIAAGVAVDQLVSVKVENADLDQLLSAVFHNTGLAVRRQGKTVTVRVVE
jgi:hypothetical protein